jgi:hypothetical protein
MTADLTKEDTWTRAQTHHVRTTADAGTHKPTNPGPPRMPATTRSKKRQEEHINTCNLYFLRRNFKEQHSNSHLFQDTRKRKENETKK